MYEMETKNNFYHQITAARKIVPVPCHRGVVLPGKF